MPLALLALFVGYLLINAGIRGEHPWCEIVRAFGGSCPPAPGVSPGQPGSIEPGPQTNIDPKTGGVVGGDYGPVSGATPAAASFWRDVSARFDVTNAGICTKCRAIIPHGVGSSNTISEHSWCNAVDVKGSAATMARVMVWANLHRRKYKIVNLIGPGTKVNVVHADFAPTHGGTFPQDCPRAA